MRYMVCIVSSSCNQKSSCHGACIVQSNGIGVGPPTADPNRCVHEIPTTAATSSGSRRRQQLVAVAAAACRTAASVTHALPALTDAYSCVKDCIISYEPCVASGPVSRTNRAAIRRRASREGARASSTSDALSSTWHISR